MPGIRTVCHKLGPVHYDYDYDYNYWYTDSPLQENQTKREKQNGSIIETQKHSEVNPISV